jgi:hypothetical protein
MYLTPHGRTQNGQGNRPIFIERSGKRRRILRFTAIALGGACGAYLTFAAIVVAGLWQPAGQQPPTTGDAVPAAPVRHDAGQGAGDGEEGRPSGRSPSAPPDDSPSSRPAGVTGG